MAFTVFYVVCFSSGSTGDSLEVWRELDLKSVEKDLKGVLSRGITSLAVLLLHSYTSVWFLYNLYPNFLPYYFLPCVWLLNAVSHSLLVTFSYKPCLTCTHLYFSLIYLRVLSIVLTAAHFMSNTFSLSCYWATWVTGSLTAYPLHSHWFSFTVSISFAVA